MIFYAALLLFVIVINLLWKEIPADHPDRNFKVFMKWCQVVFFTVILVEKLDIIYRRFIGVAEKK